MLRCYISSTREFTLLYGDTSGETNVGAEEGEGAIGLGLKATIWTHGQFALIRIHYRERDEKNVSVQVCALSKNTRPEEKEKELSKIRQKEMCVNKDVHEKMECVVFEARK